MHTGLLQAKSAFSAKEKTFGVGFQPSSAFCAVSELGPRWGPPELAMGVLLGPVHKGLLKAKSAFSAKEKTFGVGLKLRRPPAKQQCPRSQRQPRPTLALWGAEG